MYINHITKKPKMVLGPSSYSQKVFLTDDTTDIIFYGGGELRLRLKPI